MNQNDLKCVKFIAFDLDTKQLKMFMDRYQTAYEEIKKFMLDNNFEHEQGSCYISKVKFDAGEIVDLIVNIKNQFEWFAPCVKKLCVTNVGKQYDLTDILRDDILNYRNDNNGFEDVISGQAVGNNLKNKTKLIKR